MGNSMPKSLFVLCALAPITARAQQSDSLPQNAGPTYFFSVGSRPADIGTGFSIYSATSATADQQFHVQCSCQDFSLAVATCPTARYACYCSPSASLVCQ